MARILVFAYGSNLNEKQMRARCPSAKRFTTAVLPGHELVFAGYSYRWGGAVASLVRRPDTRVPGVLYRVLDADLARLDGFEGCPRAYRRRQKLAITPWGRALIVDAYLQPSDALRVYRPSARYFRTVWRAYERLGFDLEPLLKAGLLAL
jgi:gamma-glutamylcyclotransferase (GGCT)/AIG2-like uncharacterized protein YtfP